MVFEITQLAPELPEPIQLDTCQCQISSGCYILSPLRSFRPRNVQMDFILITHSNPIQLFHSLVESVITFVYILDQRLNSQYLFIHTQNNGTQYVPRKILNPFLSKPIFITAEQQSTHSI